MHNRKEKKRLKTNEESPREILNNVKYTNIRIIGVLEEEREKGTEKTFKEIIVENFPNMGKEPFTQILGAQQVPYKINPRRNIPRHILIKLTKTKDKEKMKAAREKKQITYKGIPIRLSVKFFSKNAASQKRVA